MTPKSPEGDLRGRNSIYVLKCTDLFPPLGGQGGSGVGQGVERGLQ
jgi:hypothetical protein